jgi:hypothetical protein
MSEAKPIVILALAASLLAGCVKDEDDRLAEIAAEHARQQAAQNQEMARLNREIATGSRNLVEADAKSRDELLAMSREVQEQQNQLEAERRALAVERRRESLLAPILSTSLLLVVCSLPLVLCWYLLHGLRQDAASAAELNEVLIVELAAEQPAFLPAPAAFESIDHCSDRSITDEDSQSAARIE